MFKYDISCGIERAFLMVTEEQYSGAALIGKINQLEDKNVHISILG